MTPNKVSATIRLLCGVFCVIAGLAVQMAGQKGQNLYNYIWGVSITNLGILLIFLGTL